MDTVAILRDEAPSGAIRWLARRCLALTLVFALLVPTLVFAEIDVAATPASVSSLAQSADPASVPGHGCCCIAGLQHCWYRPVEADVMSLVARQPGQRPTYLFANEAARSVTKEPLRKPPKAQVS